MKNKTLIKLGKDILKRYLNNCTPEEITRFKRMYSSNDLNKNIDVVVDEMDSDKIEHAITQCENTLNSKERPYLLTISGVRTFYGYNSNYGDSRECVCGHPYYRHFDTYDKMYPCGCKYCGCGEFVESTDDSKEEIKCKNLLIPRYEVINDYPKSRYEIGHIIVVDWTTDEYDNFPHIYRKLNWYEKRTEDDMPKYVKFVWENKINNVLRVTSWLYNTENEINGFSLRESESSTYSSIIGWSPATKKEYDEFIKKQNNE